MAFILNLLLILNSALASDIPVEKLKREYNELIDKKFVLLPHKKNYLLLLSYEKEPNRSPYENFINRDEFKNRGHFNKDLEGEFQISFAILIGKSFLFSDYKVFGAYTQKNFWQLYNSDWSRQFRETNYSPELFLRKVHDVKWGNHFHLIAHDLGYVHESNGQIQELSRSWDRLFVRTFIYYRGFVIIPSAWYRLKGKKENNQLPNGQEFLGHGEIRLEKNTGIGRLSFKGLITKNQPAVEFGYSYPITETINFYLKGNYGHGVSLIDYRHEAARVGIGIVTADLFSVKD
jgi:phospholipase A1